MPDNLKLNVTVEVDARTGQLRVVEKDLDRLNRQTERTGRTTGRAADGTMRFNAGLRRQRRLAEQNRQALLGLAAAATGLYVGGRLVQGVIETSAAFEQLRIRLKVFEGSAEAGARRFEELQGYAARTPFALREVVDSFLELEATNFRPQLDDLRALGDIAAASGRPLGQLTQALSAVGRGENDPIEGFGFQVRKVNERVRIEWRDTVRVVEDSRTAILAAFVDIARSQGAFQGATEELANSLTGALSNLGDSADRFIDRIGAGGVAPAVEDMARAIGALADESGGLADGLGAVVGVGLRLAPFAAAIGGILLQVRLLSVAHRVLYGSIGNTTRAYGRLQRRVGTLRTAVVGLRRSLFALGGKVGIALLAAEGLAVYAASAGEAEAATDDLADAAGDLGGRLADLSAQERQRLLVDIDVDIDTARAQLDAALDELAPKLALLETLPNTGRGQILSREVNALNDQVSVLQGRLRDLGAEYQRIAQFRPAPAEEPAGLADVRRQIEGLELRLASPFDRERAQVRAKGEALLAAVREFGDDYVAEFADITDAVDALLFDIGVRELEAGLKEINASLDKLERRDRIAPIDLSGLERRPDIGPLLDEVRGQARAAGIFNVESELAAIARWETETLMALEAAGIGWDRYTDLVRRTAGERREQIEQEARLEELADSDRVLDGVRLGLERIREDTRTVAESIADSMQRAWQSAENALVAFVTGAEVSFSGLINSILADLARLVIRQSITGPLAQALSGALGGLFAPGAGSFGPAVPGSGQGIALAPVLRHSGGLAGDPSGRYRTGLDPALFYGAQRLHRGGLVGEEVPIVALRGERVLSRQETAAYDAQPRQPKVELNIENRGSPVEPAVQDQRWDGQTLVIDVMLEDISRRGPLSQSLQRTFGLREQSV